MHLYTSLSVFKQESCQNYVRILAQPSSDRLLVCGTNSFRPMCHLYQINASSYTLETEKSGQAIVPYDPQHNSTAVYVGKLYYFSTVYIIYTYCRFMYFFAWQWQKLFCKTRKRLWSFEVEISLDLHLKKRKIFDLQIQNLIVNFHRII